MSSLLRKALVLDDDQELLAGTAKLLTKIGLEVLPASTIDRAIEIVDGFDEPFISLLDHNLQDPTRTGYDVCRHIREHHPLGLLVPVIYRSGYEQPDGYLERLKVDAGLGPTMFIKKGQAGGTDSRQMVTIVKRIVGQFDGMWDLALAQASAQALHQIALDDEVEV